MSLSFSRLASLLLTLYSSLGITSQQILDLSPAAWWRYNTGITESSGAVSAWADQSGNSRTLSQATGTNQPALQADFTILFDGVDNFMKASGFTLDQPLTIVLLFKQVTWGTNDYIYDGNVDDTTRLRQNDVTPDLRAGAGVDLADNTNLAVDTWGASRFVVNGASSLFQINLTAATTGDAGADNAGGFTLGKPGTTGGNYANIQVGEVILFPSAITDAQWSVVVYPWLKQQAALFGALI